MPRQDLPQPEFGSDIVVNLLHAFGIEYAAINPGAILGMVLYEAGDNRVD